MRMQSAEMRTGRVFVLRLSTGESLNDTVEAFCRDKGIRSATFTVTGGVASGSRLVVGPELPCDDARIRPQFHTVEGPAEITGTGTVFCDDEGVPRMHMHGSVGRSGRSVTGCFRGGIVCWLVEEVVITELLGDVHPVRAKDPETGMKLLRIGQRRLRPSFRSAFIRVRSVLRPHII